MDSRIHCRVEIYDGKLMVSASFLNRPGLQYDVPFCGKD